MADWLEQKIVRLGELNNVEEKKDILSEIKIKLESLNNRETEQISRNVDFSQLFTQLTSNDREYIDQVCEILKALFGILELGEVYQRYSAEISQLIIHPIAEVRSLVLHEILCIVSNSQKISLVIKDISLLVAIINRIADENLMVAKCAMCVMKEIGKNSNGLQILYTGELLRSFARLLVKNDTISFRIYEVIVDVAKSSKEGLEASAQSGFLNSLFDILESEDILLQVNALEILTQLALTEEGLSYLEQQDVVRKLVQKIAQANENPLSNLLIPGLMKFFGNVACYWPNEIFSKYPIVVSALFEVIESGDQTILGVALDTLGHVSMCVEGKYALQALGDAMPCALKKIAEIIQRMPTTLRIRGLNNLALILAIQKVEQDNRILSLTKSWFDSLCDDPLGMIVALCRQPFADIRQAGLEVMAVLASQIWGQEYISSYPGLVEFLLDRNIESFKECKEAKYEVVKQLVEAEQDIFDANTMQRFREFVNQGPHYVDINTEVAIEGGP
ncbi:26S proteasome non-ATPase regulatory subunit 5 [Apis mellifera caucasica]|uniref:26S proteasome non-ATPase regulatory subunit 5 n=1 Tax=Apis mellifera TaxID=7460 RepID=A0A7M7GJZ4_APIME|nr:26S proteasome non-ATPase regulatory subunit 5 [Apis mellifera]KAG6801963.1 26S proteasome non-ATPase regulatory subunit 5 [Apis mellifera caucasica]KAG9433359.1 26S proteasome non-ATPase regulatory subunit 5 [Apis mellifera carnica]|eukprot:XP_006558513.3 26S proteasome non-ATPase regulatory subunit 5 [Apis mellifera]